MFLVKLHRRYPASLLLMVALIFFLFLPSFFQDALIKDVVIYSFLFLLVLAGVALFRYQKNRFYLALFLGVAIFFTNLLPIYFLDLDIFMVRMLLILLFFGLLTFQVFYRLAIARRIDAQLIYAAINGYLLLGLLGGLGFRLIFHFYESAFSLDGGLTGKIDDMTYFSFVTLTTLGYGDITPAHPASQSLAALMGITGQLYLAIVIGIIIGKFSLFGRKTS